MHRPYNIFPAFRITLPPGKPFFDYVPVAVAVRSNQISFGIFQEQIAAYPSFCQKKKHSVLKKQPLLRTGKFSHLNKPSVRITKKGATPPPCALHMQVVLLQNHQIFFIHF